MVNMRSAASVTPKVLVSHYVPSTGAPQYQPATDDGAQLTSITLHNQDSSSRTVIVAIVAMGGSAAAANEITYTLAAEGTAGDTIELGERLLGGGDFIWMQASVASKIVVQITGAEFSDSAGAVVAGVHVDYIGTVSKGASGSLTPSTNKTSSLPNRRLVAGLVVIQNGTFVTWTSYAGGGPTINCTDGPMTRKASVDFNNGAGGSNLTGSVHIFTYDNPTAGLTQSLTPAANPGATPQLIVGSASYSGVDLTAGLGAVTTGPAGTAVMSMPYTMGVGDVPVFAGAFQDRPPLGFNMTPFGFDAILSGFAIPQWLVMAHLFGASSLTAAGSNSQDHCTAGIVLKAA